MPTDRVNVYIDRFIWNEVKEHFEAHKEVLRRYFIRSATRLVEEAIMEFLENDFDDYLEGGKLYKIKPLKRFEKKD